MQATVSDVGLIKGENVLKANELQRRKVVVPNCLQINDIASVVSDGNIFGRNVGAVKYSIKCFSYRKM